MQASAATTPPLFQNALNNTAANGQALLVPAGSYNISPIFFPNNSQLVLAAGVTVTANPGYGPLDKMLNITSQNVSIQGAGAASVIFQMRKSEYVAEHSTDNSEWRHCLDIEGASNVTISGISCNQSGGDGIYVADGAAGPSQNVTIANSVFDQNFRQGFSLISGVHIFVSNCYFTNTSGTAPEAGIDIEPNTPNNTVADVHITNNFSTGNAGAGLLIALGQLNGSSPSVDITVSNYQSASNQLSGYELSNNDVSPNVQGNILIQNSSSTNDGSYGAVGHGFDADGPTVVFQNLSITNPHKNGPDPTYGDSAAVGCLRGGGGSYPIGNIQFQAVSIAVTNGMVNRYFNFQDYSNIGVQKMVFNPTALSGASLVPPARAHASRRIQQRRLGGPAREIRLVNSFFVTPAFCRAALTNSPYLLVAKSGGISHARRVAFRGFAARDRRLGLSPKGFFLYWRRRTLRFFKVRITLRLMSKDS